MHCNATLVSPLDTQGRHHAGAAARDGVALFTADRRKRAQPITRNSPVSGHSASWCWQSRSAGGGTVMQSPCSGVSFVCASAGSRHARAGPAAGGACSALLRSGRCAAPSWGGGCRHPCPRGRRGRCLATSCRLQMQAWMRRSLPLSRPLGLCASVVTSAVSLRARCFAPGRRKKTHSNQHTID